MSRPWKGADLACDAACILHARARKLGRAGWLGRVNFPRPLSHAASRTAQLPAATASFMRETAQNGEQGGNARRISKANGGRMEARQSSVHLAPPAIRDVQRKLASRGGSVNRTGLTASQDSRLAQTDFGVSVHRGKYVQRIPPSAGLRVNSATENKQYQGARPRYVLGSQRCDDQHT